MGRYGSCLRETSAQGCQARTADLYARVFAAERAVGFWPEAVLGEVCPWQEPRRCILSTQVCRGWWDNIAEGLLSAVKGEVRRIGALRGGHSRKWSNSVNAQAAASLLREGGLFSVLRAMKAFREAFACGEVQLSPRDERHAWLVGEVDDQARSSNHADVGSA